MTVVRTAGPEDVALLARLREEWAAEQRGGPVDDHGFADVFAAWFEREAQHRLAWLAEVGGAPVGMLNMLVFTRLVLSPRRAVGAVLRKGRLRPRHEPDGQRPVLRKSSMYAGRATVSPAATCATAMTHSSESGTVHPPVAS